MLSDNDIHYLSQRKSLHADEEKFVRKMFQAAHTWSTNLNVPISDDERADSFEASIIRYVVSCREGV